MALLCASCVFWLRISKVLSLHLESGRFIHAEGAGMGLGQLGQPSWFHFVSGLFSFWHARQGRCLRHSRQSRVWHLVTSIRLLVGAGRKPFGFDEE